MNFDFLARSRTAMVTAALMLPLVYSSVTAADAGSLEGLWRTPADPNSGESSVVELFAVGPNLAARIVKAHDKNGNVVDRICEKCPGALKGKAITGLVFIEGLVRKGDRWVDGRVVDLRPGLTQGMRGTVDVSLENGKAVVHGYKGFRALGETSIWQRER